MKPILLSWGDFHVMSYGLFVAASYVVGTLYMRRYRREMGLSEEDFWNLVLCLSVGALVGGRLGSILFYYRGPWKGQVLSVLFVKGGFSFLHGFWTSALLGTLFCRQTGKELPRIADFAAVAMPLAHAVGRLGCLMAGCCYGRPTDWPWGLVFTDPLSAVPDKLRGIPLHPTQLYESGGNLLIAFFLHLLLTGWSLKGKLRPGVIFWSYILSYSTLRFLTDPLRGVDPGRLAGILSTAQWTAVAGAAAALFFLKPWTWKASS